MTLEITNIYAFISKNLNTKYVINIYWHNKDVLV